MSFDRLFNNQRPCLPCADIDCIGLLSSIVEEDGGANDNVPLPQRRPLLSQLVEKTMETDNEPA